MILRDLRSSRERIPAVFRSRFARKFRSAAMTAGDVEVYISVIFRAIEHLLVARNEREKKTGMGTAVATVGKRRCWLRYQLLGIRNGEAIEFPETKGTAERDATRGFVSRSSLNCLQSLMSEG